jgi:hypothetical protein
LTEDLFHSNLCTVEKCVPFSSKILCFAELQREILPVQIRAQTRYRNWASFIHGGLFLLTQDTTGEHLIIENLTWIWLYFKNVLTRKGVENFKLANGTNKRIANFRENIPLTCRIPVLKQVFRLFFHVRDTDPFFSFFSLIELYSAFSNMSKTLCEINGKNENVERILPIW